MTRPRNARNGFVPVFAIAAIALVCAGTMVVSSQQSDPARLNAEPQTRPAGERPILWNVG